MWILRACDERDGRKAAEESNCSSTEDPEIEMAPKATPLPAKRTVCKADDYLVFVEYLEEEGNYGKLFGSTKTVVSGKYLKREDAWSLAATELAFIGFKQTTWKNLYKKWNRYLAKYKEAKAIEFQTGGGLSDEDLSKGITLGAKLNSICNHYYKMDALVGKKPQIEQPGETGPMGCERFMEDMEPKENETSDHSDSPIDLGETAIGETPGWEIPGFGETPGHESGWMDSFEAKEGQNCEDEEQPNVEVVAADPKKKPQIAKQRMAAKTKQKIVQAKQKVQEARQRALSSQKPTLVAVFQGSKTLEATMRYKAIECKKELRIAQVEEMKAIQEEDEKRREELHEEYRWREEDRLHARLQLLEERKLRREETVRDSRLEMSGNKTQIILVGWTRGKKPEEIEHMLNLFNPKDD